MHWQGDSEFITNRFTQYCYTDPFTSFTYYSVDFVPGFD